MLRVDLLSTLNQMYIHPIDVSFNGTHWNKWDQEIKKMGVCYTHCVILNGLHQLEINPSFPNKNELKKLQTFCEKETAVFY